MVQRCGGTCFTLKALAALRISRYVVRQHFQRDLPAQLHVLGEIHVAHSTAAEQPFDPIVSEAGADHVMSINKNGLQPTMTVNRRPLPLI
jgi:hypothetical protein